MLSINSKGNLIPANAIECDLETLRKVFVEEIGGSNRAALFENLLIFCRQFCRTLGLSSLKIWVNGSFATSKPEPRDLDLLVFVNHELFELHQAEIKKEFNRRAWKNSFRLDVYLLEDFPANHPKHFFSISDRAYWLQQFTQTRSSRLKNIEQKGFLELNLTQHEIGKI